MFDWLRIAAGMMLFFAAATPRPRRGPLRPSGPMRQRGLGAREADIHEPEPAPLPLPHRARFWAKKQAETAPRAFFFAAELRMR